MPSSSDTSESGEGIPRGTHVQIPCTIHRVLGSATAWRRQERGAAVWFALTDRVGADDPAASRRSARRHTRSLCSSTSTMVGGCPSRQSFPAVETTLSPRCLDERTRSVALALTWESSWDTTRPQPQPCGARSQPGRVEEVGRPWRSNSCSADCALLCSPHVRLH
jgi:hypothetical protein